MVLVDTGDSNSDYMADMDLPPSSSDDDADSEEEQQPQSASAVTDNFDDASSDAAASPSSLPEQNLDSPTERSTAISPEPSATANGAVGLERSLSGNLNADQMRHAFEMQMRKMQLREASQQPPKPA